MMKSPFAYKKTASFLLTSRSMNAGCVYPYQNNSFIPYDFHIKLHNIFIRIFQNRVIYNVRSNLDNGFLGEVTEWLKVLAWNAGVVKATEGSNPSLTAIIRWTSTDTNILNDGRVPVTVDP